MDRTKSNIRNLITTNPKRHLSPATIPVPHLDRQVRLRISWLFRTHFITSSVAARIKAFRSSDIGSAAWEMQTHWREVMKTSYDLGACSRAAPVLFTM